MSIDVSSIHAQVAQLGCLELASRLGFRTRGSHNRARGACPIHGGHNTQTFSLTLKDAVLVAHCFGCGFAGDVIELVGAVRGLDEFAAKVNATLDVLSMAPIPEQAPKQVTDAPPIDALSYYNVVTALINECRKHRPIADVARYLRSRGILGVAPEYGLFALPPCDKQRTIIDALHEQFELETLVAAGVLRRTNDGQVRRDVLSFARNRVCIPWRGPDGHIETLQRRVLDSSNPRYVFPKGIKARHPFGVERLKDAPKDTPIAFVEGALDCLSLATICRNRGLDIVPLALGSVTNWGKNWEQYCNGREVYLCLDADKAGDTRMPELAVLIDAAGASSIRWWRPEHGKDWGDELLAGAA